MKYLEVEKFNTLLGSFLEINNKNLVKEYPILIHVNNFEMKFQSIIYNNVCNNTYIRFSK